MQLQVTINDFPRSQPIARALADMFRDGVTANLFANKSSAGKGFERHQKSVGEVIFS